MATRLPSGQQSRSLYSPIPTSGTIASMTGGSAPYMPRIISDEEAANMRNLPPDAAKQAAYNSGALTQPMSPSGTLTGAPAPASYTGAPLQVGQQSVAFNPQSFVNSDAYNFIGDEGRNQIERGAAAKGTLLTGGTLKDLTRWGQGNASTFWGQQLDHDYRMSALNAGISGGNADRALSGMSSLVNAGSNAANGMGNAYVGAGNAAAGGTIGAQNQVNTGVSNVANTIGEILARRRANRNPTTGGAWYSPNEVGGGG